MTAKLAADAQKAQKDAEKRYQQEVKLRNQEIIAEQKQRGTRGPTLLEKEEMKKRQQFSEEIHDKMEKRREAKLQREQDKYAKMGLAMQDKRKKREFKEVKQRRLEEEEVVKREQEMISRQKLMHRDKNVLNKDLIDFAHPENAVALNAEKS